MWGTVEFPEPRVRQPVKPPVCQLVELLELHHQPLELHELVIRQLAEFLGQPVERRGLELLVPQDTVRLPWKIKGIGRNGENRRPSAYGS